MIFSSRIISQLSFPGVILHEISHRFFCDINNIPVYAINYFEPFSTKAGHVIHKKTNNIYHAFFISVGPLIINSIVCMFLALPHTIIYILKTDKFEFNSYGISVLYGLMTWIGFSAGFNAIPSNQDMSGLVEMAESRISKIILYIFTKVIFIFNIGYIGFWLHVLYAVFLPYLIAKLLFV